MATVLIAETEPRTLEVLPQLLADHLEEVTIDLCRSAEELCHKPGLSTYDTMVVSPIILQGFKLLKPKWARHVASPVLVTANSLDRISASQCLAKEAFDLIVKPLVPKEAVQSVRRALWQNKLLTLLASRERSTAVFRQHMAAFPLDGKPDAQYVKERETFAKTFQAIQDSERVFLSSDEDQSLINFAGWVVNFTKERALERLLSLCQDGTSH